MSRLSALAIVAAGLMFAPLAASAQDTKEAPPLGTASFTPPESKNQEPLTPEVFAVRAAVVNMNEIELSELALQKSGDAQLRQYASRVIEDHKASQAKLKKIAANAQVALPGTVDTEHRDQKTKLAEQTGSDFDRQYVQLMHAGHQEAEQLLESAAAAPELAPTFKSYARETLDTVATHRDETAKLMSQLDR